MSAEQPCTSSVSMSLLSSFCEPLAPSCMGHTVSSGTTMRTSGWNCLCVLLSWHVTTIVAMLINVTVDDQSTDMQSGFKLTYSGAWQDGQSCSSCGPLPDPQQVHGGTWRDATYNASFASESSPEQARVSFTGTQSQLGCEWSELKNDATRFCALRLRHHSRGKRSL